MMEFVNSRPPLWVRLLTLPFLALSILMSIQRAAPDRVASLWPTLILLLLALFFVSLWFMRLRITYDTDKKILLVNRSGFVQRIPQADVVEIRVHRVIMKSISWAVEVATRNGGSTRLADWGASESALGVARSIANAMGVRVVDEASRNASLF